MQQKFAEILQNFQNMLSASERINAVIRHSGMSARAFSERIGMARPQAIYDIQSGKTKSLTPKMVSAIAERWPEIDRYWLMTGEGEMLRIAENMQKSPAIQDEPLILTGDAKLLVMNMSNTLHQQEQNITRLTELVSRLTSGETALESGKKANAG